MNKKGGNHLVQGLGNIVDEAEQTNFYSVLITALF